MPTLPTKHDIANVLLNLNKSSPKDVFDGLKDGAFAAIAIDQVISAAETVTDSKNTISPYAKAVISVGLITFSTIGHLAMKWADRVKAETRPRGTEAEQSNNSHTVIEMANTRF